MPVHSLPPTAATGAAAGAAAAPAATTASAPAPLPPGTSSVPGGAVAAHNAGRGSVMRNLSSGAQQIARDTYAENRLYHGSSKAGKASIQQDGFDISKKAGGATETVPGLAGSSFAHRAAAHNFLTGSLDTAKSYAVTGRSGDPAIVRTMVDHTAAGLERDPDSQRHHLAYRTPQSIPAENVLQSKNHGDHDLSGLANQHYREQLHGKGVELTETQARDLLAEVQSDSDSDDFSTARSMTAK